MGFGSGSSRFDDSQQLRRQATVTIQKHVRGATARTQLQSIGKKMVVGTRLGFGSASARFAGPAAAPTAAPSRRESNESRQTSHDMKARGRPREEMNRQSSAVQIQARVRGGQSRAKGSGSNANDVCGGQPSQLMMATSARVQDHVDYADSESPGHVSNCHSPQPLVPGGSSRCVESFPDDCEEPGGDAPFERAEGVDRVRPSSGDRNELNLFLEHHRLSELRGCLNDVGIHRLPDVHVLKAADLHEVGRFDARRAGELWAQLMQALASSSHAHSTTPANTSTPRGTARMEVLMPSPATMSAPDHGLMSTASCRPGGDSHVALGQCLIRGTTASCLLVQATQPTRASAYERARQYGSYDYSQHLKRERSEKRRSHAAQADDGSGLETGGLHSVGGRSTLSFMAQPRQPNDQYWHQCSGQASRSSSQVPVVSGTAQLHATLLERARGVHHVSTHSAVQTAPAPAASTLPDVASQLPGARHPLSLQGDSSAMSSSAMLQQQPRLAAVSPVVRFLLRHHEPTQSLATSRSLRPPSTTPLLGGKLPLPVTTQSAREHRGRVQENTLTHAIAQPCRPLSARTGHSRVQGDWQSSGMVRLAVEREVEDAARLPFLCCSSAHGWVAGIHGNASNPSIARPLMSPSWSNGAHSVPSSALDFTLGTACMSARSQTLVQLRALREGANESDPYESTRGNDTRREATESDHGGHEDDVRPRRAAAASLQVRLERRVRSLPAQRAAYPVVKVRTCPPYDSKPAAF